jgi:uncharacterized membrane protein YdjX (TVP38/TMEM64 family)
MTETTTTEEQPETLSEAPPEKRRGAEPEEQPGEQPEAEPEKQSGVDPGGGPGADPDKLLDKQAKKPITTADKVKFAGLIVFFLLIIAASVFAVDFVRSMGSDSLEVELERAVREAGVFGVLICLGVQFIQVVVAFIPGEVVQIVIGYVYGTFWGGILTLAGALISSVFVFYLVRKLGAPFVQAMVGNKDSGRMRFIHNNKNLNSLVFILYLIPGLPKDLFTYVFPLTDMRPSSFFVLSTIARAPAIFASTYVAASFKSGDYLGMIIVAVIFGGIGILGIVFNQKIMAFVDRLMARLSPRHHDQEA